MHTLAVALIVLIALLHLWILVLEMFLWRTPFGRKRFQMSAEKAEQTAVLAGNQGLYNGFLAAGLVWAVLSPPGQLVPRATFFLVCVAVAGIYGGLTALRAILFIQAAPALIALLLLWAS